MSPLVYSADVQPLFSYLTQPTSCSICVELLQFTANCRHRQFTHHIFLESKYVRPAECMRVMFRVLHNQSICQEGLNWHRLRLLHGNIAVRFVVKASSICCIIQFYSITEDSKSRRDAANPRKIGLPLGYLQGNQVNSYPRPVHKLHHSCHAYLAYPVLRNTFSKHTTKILIAGNERPSPVRKRIWP